MPATANDHNLLQFFHSDPVSSMRPFRPAFRNSLVFRTLLDGALMLYRVHVRTCAVPTGLRSIFHLTQDSACGCVLG